MKVLNIVLSIVILILAAVSAVAAYMLWEKRTQMTDGWSKMAAAINKASAAIDRDSGTRIASDLSVASLSTNSMPSWTVSSASSMPRSANWSSSAMRWPKRSA